jgi:phage terminase large subunit GpA-like protein
MNSNLLQMLQASRIKILKPATKLNLVEWADKYRFLSPESSSMPGKWRTSMVEAARGPMLAVTDPSVKRISVMACTQFMKTELMINTIGYFVHQDPSPIIVMQPTGSLAETFSKDRIDKMIRDTPVLKELIADKKSRDSGNTIGHKQFVGGHLTIIGSNSPSELASRPVRITLRDEIDKYEDNKEGDPSSLIRERSSTFWNSLDIGACSPTIKGRSKIEAEYLASDRRKFYVPCPHCDHAQVLTWKQVRWENNDPETASYQCEECTALWDEAERLKAISKGFWQATAPFKGHAGFHVNKLASPWDKLSTLVTKWLEAQTDASKLRTFINTQLAETWEEKGEAPEHMRLYERRALYPINTCPEGVVFLTAGCDVQKDRLEIEIVGWGRGKQSWSIDYRVIMGETTTAAPWIELDSLLNETWTLHNGQQTQVRVLAIDSGYNTQHVYNWARKYTGNRVMVVKGQDAQQNILGVPTAADVTHNGKRASRSVRVWPVGVSTLKSELYGFLNLKSAGDDGIYPPGFCFFPQYGEEFFKMLTAEQLMKRIVNGRTVYKWVKTHERNEALDCRNYARAAAAMIGLDRFKEQDWINLSGSYVPKPVIKPEEQKQINTIPNRPKPTAPQNNFWRNNGSKKSFW